jgi:DeoR/GlpR family transcriptional regulator of sugar metabolism
MTTDALETKQEKRRSEILRILLDEREVPIKDLAGRLDVSQMTVHRDLNALQDQGFVRRLRGAVTAEKSMLFESSYLYRKCQQVEEKRRLVRAAMRHIEPGNAIVWDDSTTTFEATEYIEHVAPVTVITNALPVMERLQTSAEIDLIALGGRYHRAFNAFFGIACERAIRSYRVDVALMSTTTVQELAIYTQDEQVVRTKQAMIEIARKRLLLVDSTKFGFTALNHVADLTDFDLVLVPSTVALEVLDRMRQGGVTFEVV